MSRKKRQSKQKRQRYDVEMIRDFLEHLKWELNIKHFESNYPNKTNPELVEQLEQYIVKRNTAGLLYGLYIDTKGISAEDAEESIKSFRIAEAEIASEAIDALESLERVFEEALDCATKPDGVIIREIKLADIQD